MELREDIRSLNMLKNTYLENKYEIEDNIKLLPDKIAKTEKIIEGIAADTKAIKAYVPKKDIDGKEVFEMKVGNQTDSGLCPLYDLCNFWQSCRRKRRF